MKKNFWITIIVAFTNSVFAQDIPKYLDYNLSIDERIEDLILRMTIEEKVSQMSHNSPAIERLKIPAYNWWNEALHGVARNGLATVFPMPIALASTWDKDLIYRIASVISDEARAKYNLASRKNKVGIYNGITLWAPNINIFRDPRWGRGMETYGEDPFLTGELAVQFIKGLQGNDKNYLKTVATPKHFAVHSGPESERHHFNAIVNEYDLRETYLPHFYKCIIEGNAKSIMCAYNRVLGEPCCGNNYLLKDILHKEWKFDGLVVSDCWAVSDIFNSHKYTNSLEEAVSLSLIAGTSLECGNSYHLLLNALQNGLIKENDIDNALRKIFKIRFQLGMFDPPEKVIYSKIDESYIDSEQNKLLALEAARKSIVLLKNKKNILPLKRNYKNIAVIGPNADNLESLLGNYHGFPSDPITPLKAIKGRMKDSKIYYERGCYFAENVPSFDLISSDYLFVTKDKKQNGLRGEYFSNTNMNGQADFERIDSVIDFKWLTKNPVANSDTFSVRWTGYLMPPESGSYAIGGYGYNGFRIYIDDSLIVNYYGEFDPAITYSFIKLEKEKLYKIKVELYKKERYSFMQLLWALPEEYSEKKAIDAVKKSDLVMMFMGLTPRLEGEALQVESKEFRGGDRLTLNLPEVQLRFIKKIHKLGKPIILILMNGSPLSINWENKHIPSIIEAWYPGQSGGKAIWDIILGTFNPSAKLPVTFYKSVNQLPPFTDYNMDNRTYRYFKGEVLYPFGYGLSYTSFAINNLMSERKIINKNDTFYVSCDIINRGKIKGEETIQMYIKYKNDEKELKALKGFKKVILNPGQKSTVKFKITPDLLKRWSENGYEVKAGEYIIMIGTSSNEQDIKKIKVFINN